MRDRGGAVRERRHEENMTEFQRERWLRVVLWATALHSCLTGLVLIAQPPALLQWGGFAPVHEHFFPAQGGVFHVLMAVLYAATAARRQLRDVFVGFIVLIKGTAAVFLLGYFFLVDPVWLLLLSGVTDGGVAVLLLLLRPDRKSAEELR